jgi:hypothetical protein
MEWHNSENSQMTLRGKSQISGDFNIRIGGISQKIPGKLYLFL